MSWSFRSRGGGVLRSVGGFGLEGWSGAGGHGGAWRSCLREVQRRQLSGTLGQPGRISWLLSEDVPKGFGKFAGRNGEGKRAEGRAEEHGETPKTENVKSEGSAGEKRGQGGDGGGGPEGTNWSRQLLLFGTLMGAAALLSGSNSSPRKEISFHSFLWDFLFQNKVQKVEVVDRTFARVYLKPGAQVPGLNPPANAAADGWAPYYFTIGSVDSFERKLEEAQEDNGVDPDEFVTVVYNNNSEVGIVAELLKSAPTLLVILAVLWMVRGTISNLPGVGGRNIFQVGKASPVIVKGTEKGAKATTFADVAGLDEAKVEVIEFVDFLKNPKRYEKLGASIPKGALLVGPPGTGKTLLAKATAGEANVPFFSMSGSDFIEMFVGVGPARVRDLFSQARAQAPCIVFIDEIDAVGRARGRGGFTGGNDERENTLNALLVEMDGFSTSSGVVVLAGTNRADILDKALLRPGRFDRQILIDKPDIRGRFQIFKVHLKPLKLAEDADTVAKKMATLTPGFAGADIANICNEAALIAARQSKKAVELVDFEAAADRILGGIEKKARVVSREEKEIVAHHEAGHAVAGWFSEYADPLMKVSIIPRGESALGLSQYMPIEKKLMNTMQLSDFCKVALGGRVAENLIFSSVTTGAHDDLQKVTRAVYAQVTKYGMSNSVGKVFFPADSERQEMYKPYSEETAELIDNEAKRFVETCRVDCENLLTEKIALVKKVAAELIEKETLREDDLVRILGPRPFAKVVDYDTFVGRFEKDQRERTKSDSTPEEEVDDKKDKPKRGSGESNVELELA